MQAFQKIHDFQKMLLRKDPSFRIWSTFENNFSAKIAVLGVKNRREWVRILLWPLVVKLFLSNYWLPAQVAPPGMLPACWKNNRLEKSVVQIYTKNSHQKWLVKMVRLPKLVSSPKKFPFGDLLHQFL